MGKNMNFSMVGSKNKLEVVDKKLEVEGLLIRWIFELELHLKELRILVFKWLLQLFLLQPIWSLKENRRNVIIAKIIMMDNRWGVLAVKRYVAIRVGTVWWRRCLLSTVISLASKFFHVKTSMSLNNVEALTGNSDLLIDNYVFRSVIVWR